MNLSAYDLFVMVLDINETIEKIKDMNVDDQPNLALCSATELLTDYRDICIALLKQTPIILENPALKEFEKMQNGMC